MMTDGPPLISGASRAASQRFSRSPARLVCAERFAGQSLDFVPFGASCTLGTSSRSRLIPRSRLGPSSGFPQADVGYRNPPSLAVGRAGCLEPSSRLQLSAGHSEVAVFAEIVSSARSVSAPLRMPVSSVVDQRCPAAGASGPQHDL